MKSIAELMSMQGKAALVTGGAGHIGRAVCETLAEAGCAVAVLDRDEQSCKTVAAALRETYGVEAMALPLDLEDEAALLAAPEAVAASLGSLDVLVHCAGFVGTSNLTGWVEPFEGQSTDTWRKALEVNLTAVFTLTRACTPALRKGKGSVIAISSIYGTHGPDMGLYEGTAMGNPAAYAASKGGLLQLTRWLATTLAPDVRVNAISPGGIARGQDPKFVKRYVARTPLGRMGTEEDLKGAVLYLASDLSAYVTGQNLMVDGGWTVW